MNDILIRCGGDGRAILWRNDVGLFRNIRTGEKVKVGMPGSPDIIGFLRNGDFIGIEVKTGNADLNENQRSFKKVAESYNVKFFVARSSDEADAFISASLKG